MITFSNLGKPEWGRLGNQLFQIAGTIGIAAQNGQTAVFPKWSYALYFAKPLPEGCFSNYQIYKQKKHLYSFINLSQGNWDLLGFFQSEKFFLSVEADIRQQFTPSCEVLNYINAKYGNLLSKPTCSLHVRRGDYLKQSLSFPSQSLAYYQHAIKQFPDNTQFVVFSDDINWCRENFHGTQFIFIENETDIIDLLLMSQCKHHIISNSSFSWWGAWLNPNQEKIVLCPDRWFGPAVSMFPKTYARDIYARNFYALNLPNEITWLLNIYYIFSSPIYKIYFQIIELKTKLLHNKFSRRLRNKLLLKLNV